MNGTERKYLRGTTLFEEGDYSNALYVLVEDQLKVYTRDEKGRELVLSAISRSRVFGELFLDGEARSASVRTLVDSSCVVIDEESLCRFMNLHPEFAHHLVRQLISRLRHSTQLNKSLGLDGVYERTAALLESAAEDETSIRAIPASMTQQEIADRVVATREMVNHVIRELINGGFAARDEKRRLVLKRPLIGRWNGCGGSLPKPIYHCVLSF